MHVHEMMDKSAITNKNSDTVRWSSAMLARFDLEDVVAVKSTCRLGPQRSSLHHPMEDDNLSVSSSSNSSDEALEEEEDDEPLTRCPLEDVALVHKSELSFQLLKENSKCVYHHQRQQQQQQRKEEAEQPKEPNFLEKFSKVWSR